MADQDQAFPTGSTVRQWGATWSPEAARFTLWTPSAQRVEVLTSDGGCHDCIRSNGWHEAEVAGLASGSTYRFRVDGLVVPDPASRLQPRVVFGDSVLVDQGSYAWQDGAWTGRPWHETVLYELHIGTFSAEGTYLGAIAHLDHLASLGVTMVELMPVSAFPGARNWGYDGVQPFAPCERYGSPDALKQLVDACHGRGLSVMLDVVYNHFGPEGNWLPNYAPEFFNERHHTPWGGAVNYDGPHARAVRDYVIQNAAYWVDTFHFDGLRLDAVQEIYDDGPVHILEELSGHLRSVVRDRPIHLVLENDHNVARWLEPGARHYDAQWNDDFHHTMRVLVSGQTDGYYEDFAERPIEHLGRALTQGFSYQGQESKHRPGMMRGTPSAHLPPTAFVTFLQNHDQVGNSVFGHRLTDLAPAAAVRLGTAVLLLSPGIPMLFMGQEWGAAQPFNFFCDFEPPLADMVREGRRNEFRHFDAFNDPDALAQLADPNAPATMDASRLQWNCLLVPNHAEWLAFHRELLQVRRDALVPLLPLIEAGAARYRVLSDKGADGRPGGALEASWPLSDGRALTLAANFSDEGVPWQAADRAVLFRLDEAAQDVIQPWSMALVMQDAV